MALFYASGPRRSDSGKFRQHRRPGMQPSGRHECGEYRFELLSMESSAPVARVRYHVRIFNGSNLRVAFLRDFSSAQHALAAAREWVEHREATVGSGG